MKTNQTLKPSFRKGIPLLTAALAAAGLIGGAQAQIQTAGELLVNLDATTLSPGAITSITNSGTAGGFFEARGAAGGANFIPQVAAVNGNGTKGLRFNGTSFMQHVSAVGGAIVPAPATLVGGGPTCSIEAWAFNPSIANEETMVSWGKRGADGQNISFNYGSDFRWGAVGHWGNADIGWNNDGGAPAAGRWHHLVYTYDGTTTRVYSDGVLQNAEDFNLNTASGTPINLGTQLAQDGNVEPGLKGSLTLARVRVHSEALSPGQILNNYNFEKNDFALGTPSALASSPVHRYSFTNAPGAAVDGAVVSDSIGTADAFIRGTGATFTGTRVALPGGPSASAPYIDLPNRLLSTNSTDNGGTGEVTFEGWVKVTGSRNWSRILDFGSTDVGGVQGEVFGPGGGGSGQDYLFLSAQNGGNVDVHTVVTKNADAPGGNVEDFLDIGTYTFNKDQHFAITWKESTGEVKVYENGVEVTTLNSRSRMSGINDVNVWLGRSNWAGDDNLQGEYDEFRVYTNVLSPADIAASYQAGPNIVAAAGAPSFTTQPSDVSTTEFGSAQFIVGAKGNLPISIQWYKNGTPIPGANSSILSLTNIPFSNNGAVIFARASNNIAGTPNVIESSHATLTVMDEIPPTVLQVRVAGTNSVEIIFSERVSPADANNTANYNLSSFIGNQAIASAVLAPDGTHVLLTTAEPFLCTYYSVIISGIHDISSFANVIADNTTVGFLYSVPSGLQHRYTFNNPASGTTASGTIVPDIIGGANGFVKGGGATFTGNRVTLPGGDFATAAYIDLPNGLISANSTDRGGSGQLTLEGWVKVTGGRTWSRIFDIGSSAPGELDGPGGTGTGLDYLFFSAQVDGNVNTHRLEVRDEDPGGGGTFTADSATPNFNKDLHFVVTWNEASGAIHAYENGVEINGLSVPTHMSQLNDINVWLGRSNWPDQNMQGEFDEFRVYNQVLAQDQILANLAAGPDNNVGTPQSVTLSVVSTNMVLGDFQQAKTLGSFSAVPNLDLTRSGCVTFDSSDTGVISVDANGVLTALAPGSAVITANFAGASSSLVINVIDLPLVLKHRYSFCEDQGSTKAHDVVGNAHGILHGGATFSGAGDLTLNGVDGYVDLPNGIISTLTNATFEAWVTSFETRSWARIFDFGSNDNEDTQNVGSNYVALTVRGPNNLRFEAKPGNAGPTPILYGTGPLMTNLPVHLVVTYNQLAGTVRLYTNGVLLDSGLLTVPLNTISDFNNWLGRSQFNDPYLNGIFDEFRIYQGVMTPAQVLSSFTQGADAAISTTSLSITRSGTDFIISYPAGNCNFFLESSTQIGPDALWVPVSASSSQVGDSIQFVVPSDAPAKFFRLSK